MPHFIGKDVRSGGPEILKELSQHTDLSERFTTLRHVGERRWDMIDVKSGLTVKLPEGAVGQALRQLSYTQNETQWLDRQIDVIDMRVAGRISIRPSGGTQS